MRKTKNFNWVKRSFRTDHFFFWLLFSRFCSCILFSFLFHQNDSFCSNPVVLAGSRSRFSLIFFFILLSQIFGWSVSVFHFFFSLPREILVYINVCVLYQWHVIVNGCVSVCVCVFMSVSRMCCNWCMYMEYEMPIIKSYKLCTCVNLNKVYNSVFRSKFFFVLHFGSQP